MEKKLLLVVFFFLTVVGAWAQGVTTASLSGKITDQNGGELPGANVVATHMPSGTTYGTTSLKDGRYFIPAMRIGGPYTIKVSFIGYKEQTTENVSLQLGETLVLDYKLLDEASQLQEVVVTGDKDPILNSDKMGASTNFKTSQIMTLPSIGRDFRDFTNLSPQSSGSGNPFSFGGRSYLYNNLTIDGATVNNVFGLNPLPAGQSNATPFSIDAIQEISVVLSPYDVRQGNFTGAGVSAVTRSGTNEIQGSAYYFFRNEGLAGKKINGTSNPVPSFNYNNYGFRIGGPIIKNKLFFFVNAEFEKRTDPFYTNAVRPTAATPTTATNTQGSDDNDPQTGLAGLRDFLVQNFNYDPGTYKNFNRATQSQRYVARFDYNISQNTKLTIRGNITNAFQDQPPSGSGGFASSPPGGRGNSNNVLSFSSSYYRINNNQYSVTAELNSVLKGGMMSNNLVVGFNAFRDYRQNAGGLAVPNFPLVDILGPNGSNMTSFGPDPFTPNNKLDQNVTQINDNFNIYLKNHQVTIGTANELYYFNNVFTQVINGVYRYNSLADFYADAQGATTATARPAQYTVQYVAVQGGPQATAAKWSAATLGGFVQDEYTGIKNVKIIGGIRVDVPTYLTTLPKNNYLNAINLNGEHLRVGAWPTVRPLVSPRIGFNWDVKGDRSLQVRGGTGVLTGRVPFVWLSNAVSNNGLFFGQFNVTGNSVPFSNTGDGIPYDFNTKPYALPSDAPASAYADLSKGMPPMITNPLDKNYGRPAVVGAVNTIAKDFKFPQVWRSSLAVDKQLPYGIVGTAEFIFTKDINAVYIHDANLAPAQSTLNGDGRPLFGAVGSDRAIIANDRRVNGDMGQALVIGNTKKGYQWSITAQLTKTFDKNFSIGGFYTYTDSRELNPQSGSTAGSIFGSQANILGGNNPGLGYAGALTPHRVVVYGNYRKEYLQNFATSIGFSYEGRSGNNFSYIYSGDVNSDGNSANDLIYVPRDKSEIVLTTSSATDTRSTDQIWNQLNSFISQDKYLNSHRGQFAQRSGAFQPWVSRLNVNLLQDFYVNVAGHRHTIQLSAQFINVMNMLSSKWGLTRNAARTSLIRFVGYEQPHTAGSLAQPTANAGPANTIGLPWAPTTGKPVYAFDTNADGSALTNSWVYDTSVNGRWQMQLGVRYIF
jgi:hypothetical protein